MPCNSYILIIPKKSITLKTESLISLIVLCVVMEMELSHLLESGITYYYKDYSSFSPAQKRKIHKVVNEMMNTKNIDSEPVLKLVIDFYLNNEYKKNMAGAYKIGDMLGVALYEEDYKYFDLNPFLNKIIFSFNSPKGEKYVSQRNDYFADKEVQASIKDYGIDPSQFWFFLQYCKYYVISKTKKLDKSYPSVRQDLEMLVSEITRMEFEDKDWTNAYPRYTGSLSIDIEGSEKHSIIHYKTLHLLATIIQDYLEQKHSYETNLFLDNPEYMESREFIKYMYCRGNKDIMTEEEKEFYETYNPWLDNSLETKYDTGANMRIVALFTYFVEQFLKDRNPQKKYVYEYYQDYNHGIGINHNKLFLISKLLYIMGPDIHGIDKEKRKKLYDDPRYLKDCLRRYRVKDQEGVDECFAYIRKEGII